VGADVDLPNVLSFWDSHNSKCAISIYVDLKFICMFLKQAS